MKKRLTVILFSSLLILTLGTACQRTASNGVTIATPTSNVPFVTPLPNNAIQNILAGTQTAQALAGTPAQATQAVTTGAATTASTSAASQAVPSAAVTATKTAPTKTSVPSATPTISFGGLSGTYSGYPSFTISYVTKDESVTVIGSNFPPDLKFEVLMGSFASGAVGGTQVAKFSTGSGGSFTGTFAIPSSVQGADKIAIRIQDTNGYYYAYNWFWNITNH